MSRVVVLGAGVIGSVYAALLAEAGWSVTLVARGERLRHLQSDGLSVVLDGTELRPQVRVVGEMTDAGDHDVLVVCVRGDQLDTALPQIASSGAQAVLVFTNPLAMRVSVEEQIGRDRLVWCFAGVGGGMSGAGVTAHRVPQQPTVMEADRPASARAEELLSGVDARLRREPYMPDWLDTHTVFVAGMAAVILLDAPRTWPQRWSSAARLVNATREAFTSLVAQGTRIVPGDLRAIFITVPRPIATMYWAVQFTRPVVTVSMVPHAIATRHTEQQDVVRRALDLVGPAAGRYRNLVGPLVERRACG